MKLSGRAVGSANHTRTVNNVYMKVHIGLLVFATGVLIPSSAEASSAPLEASRNATSSILLLARVVKLLQTTKTVAKIFFRQDVSS